ncbi:MAG: class I SAM-dependent methyltransferase [Anaerolineaceae bacterium]
MPDAASFPPGPASYDPDYYAPLFAIEDRHFWFRARNEVISALVEKELRRLVPGYQVLEVGCGTGNVLRVLEKVCKRGQVIGMDLFLEGLEYARRRVGLGLVQGDMQAPPFGEKFQIIGLFDVLEHLPDDLQVLENLYSMLSPGGVLLLTVPAFPSLWSYFDEAGRHVRRYRFHELQTRLDQAGFKVETISYYMMSIFPLVWMQRKLAQGRSQPKAMDEKDVHDLTVNELRIVPVANQALVTILGLEARWLKSGRHLPFGTSLLAMGRKPD